MRKQAAYCDECKHYGVNPEDDSTWDKPCTLGHRPRFYTPQTLSQAHSDAWGWKRRCADFVSQEKRDA